VDVIILSLIVSCSRPDIAEIFTHLTIYKNTTYAINSLKLWIWILLKAVLSGEAANMNILVFGLNGDQTHNLKASTSTITPPIQIGTISEIFIKSYYCWASPSFLVFVSAVVFLVWINGTELYNRLQYRCHLYVIDVWQRSNIRSFSLITSHSKRWSPIR
jgi:hypothetical protein